MKSSIPLIAVLALLAWPCGAQDTSSTVKKPADGGNVTSHSQGLHGYIGFGHEKLPTDGGYSAGMGFYAAVWSRVDQPLENFQIGLPSAWIQPDNSDNKDQPLAPEGTLARKWKERGPTWSSVFQTVEGGLGYWAGNHSMKHIITFLAAPLLAPVAAHSADSTKADAETKTLRVFIFAGQSNMEGADSKVKDIQRFPPFVGLDMPQDNVLFSYNIGREEKRTSKGWVALQAVDKAVGPELSFARRVAQETKAPIAIIKCAAGGTTLGGDWNPDDPSGYKLYPLALQWIQSSLAELDQRKVAYRIEGFMWHQGENDMFNKEFKPNYGKNLKNFLASWRRDLRTPDLKFYIGELCTKTIWGMDNRENMYAIRAGQKVVTDSDPLAEYIPTSHDAVEIGGGEGLHYHYGTLGQLEHGVNYADAYFRTIGKKPATDRPLKVWPYAKGSPVKLFILAGHRNMEGERAFTQELKALAGQQALADDNGKVAFKYSIGGGYKTSNGWEPLGPSGYYDTFGPELSFGKTLLGKVPGNVAIAKFTHSGSQMNDWTPQGTDAKDRNLYPQFIGFIKESIQELQAKGHQVELAGIFYHVGENDMSFGPYRHNAAKWLQFTVTKSREDLALPALKWHVSQQPPTDEKGLKRIDVTANLAALAAADPAFIHLKAFNLPPQEEKLVLTTAGIVRLGELLAQSYLEHR